MLEYTGRKAAIRSTERSSAHDADDRTAEESLGLTTVRKMSLGSVLTGSRVRKARDVGIRLSRNATS